jgi:hypothetical protein
MLIHEVSCEFEIRFSCGTNIVSTDSFRGDICIEGDSATKMDRSLLVRDDPLVLDVIIVIDSGLHLLGYWNLLSNLKAGFQIILFSRKCSFH